MFFETSIIQFNLLAYLYGKLSAMIKRLLCLIIFFLFSLHVHASSLFISHSEKSPNDTTKIQELIDTSKFLSATDYSKALYFLDEAENLSQKINYQKGIGDVYFYRSRVYYYKDEYHISLKYLKKAKAIYDKIGSNEGLSKYYFGVGSIENLYGNYIEAIKAFQSSLQVNEKSNDRRWASVIMNSLANVNLKQKNYKIALEYANKALIIKKDLGIDRELSNAISMVGRIYKELDSLDIAEKLNIEALELRQKGKDNRRIANSLYELGIINILKKKYNKAINQLKEALNIYEQLEEKTGIVIVYIELSKAYQKIGFHNESKKSIDEALRFAKLTNNTTLIKITLKQFSEYHANEKNFEKAYNYHLKYTEINDSLANTNKTRIFNELEMKYQTSKKDNEIELLNNKNDIQKKNNIILILSTLILLFLSALFYYFYYSKSQKLQTKSQLLNKEKIIHKQDIEIKENESILLKEQLESKNRELTTRVLSMLKTNEMLDNIAKKLSTLNKSLKNNSKSTKQIAGIIREIEHESGEQLWEDFNVSFQGVHSEFYDKLFKLNPDLTATEIKMASLLKLNLNTKEIAAITFKSESSIKSTRFRLRKKLKLSSDHGLVSFLMQL